jgi:hypothetical protein
VGDCTLITPVYLEIALFSGARSGAKNKTDSAGFLTEISVQKVDKYGQNDTSEEKKNPLGVSCFGELIGEFTRTYHEILRHFLK